MSEEKEQKTKNGFTMVSDYLMWKYQDEIIARVYGKVFRFCQIKNSSVCTATVETIAKELLLSETTVRERLEILEKDGYIKDYTKGLVNKSHQRRITGKLEKEETEFWAYEQKENEERLAKLETWEADVELKRNFYKTFNNYAKEKKLEPYITLINKDKKPRGRHKSSTEKSKEQ